MVRINGKPFPIYYLDTIDSIFERLAALSKTIPKYLYFPDGLPDITQFQQDNDLPMKNLLSVIKNASKHNNFILLYNYIKPKLNQQNLDLVKDVVEPFIASNTSLSVDPFPFVLQTELNEHLKDSFETIPSVNQIYQQREYIIKRLNEEIKKNAVRATVTKNIGEEFSNTDSVISTPFELEYAVFELNYEVPNISLIELFNDIQLNSNVPFASIGKFYKILKDFKPFEIWAPSFDDYIILRILQTTDVIYSDIFNQDAIWKQNEAKEFLKLFNQIVGYKFDHNESSELINFLIGKPKLYNLLNIQRYWEEIFVNNQICSAEDIRFKKEKDLLIMFKNIYDDLKNIQKYMDTFISIDGKPGEEILTVSISYEDNKKNLPKEELIESFLSVSSIIRDSNNLSDHEIDVRGVFYYPHQSFNRYILSDLILNDPLFSSMMVIDERAKATKRKGSLYIHFYTPTIGSIKANITTKISQRNDPTLKGKDVQNEFEYNTNYIRVKISKADNEEAVQKFSALFGKFLALYNSKSTEIINIYKHFIPDFDTQETKTFVIPAKTLKDIAPEVFLENYPTKCTNAPKIITDEEVEQERKKGTVVMRYPKTDTEGFKPRNYICDGSTTNPKAIFPSLRYNTLPNKELVPYLPCCYPKDPRETEGKIYNHYFNEEELKEPTEKKQQGVYKNPNKLVFGSLFAVLPENLENMFSLLNQNEETKFVRKGAFQTSSSFIECVMEGMNVSSFTDNNFKDVDEVKAYFKFLYTYRQLSCNRQLCQLLPSINV